MARNLEAWRKYYKEYRHSHPEKDDTYRDQAAVNRLTKRGYTVIPPRPSTDQATEPNAGEGAVNG